MTLRNARCNDKDHLRMIISVINQLDAQNFCFRIILFHASTCFEHMCSSSGGQNCITQPLVSSHLQVAGTATYRCDDTRGCVMQFWPPDDEHMCSKHVEAWNKIIVKQKFCASSWLITEINILRCTVSKKSKNNVPTQHCWLHCTVFLTLLSTSLYNVIFYI